MSESLFRPGGNCCAVAHADRVAMLVDGEEYFDAFVRACEMAERQIVILAWDFDSRMVLRYDESGRPRETLGEFLNRLCRRLAYFLRWNKSAKMERLRQVAQPGEQVRSEGGIRFV